MTESKKRQNRNIFLDYLIGFPQMKSLIKNNPFIRSVYVSRPFGPITRVDQVPIRYDKIIELGPLGFEEPPVTEYKARLGLKNLDPSYKLYTNKEYDLKVRELFMTLPKDKKVIGVNISSTDNQRIKNMFVIIVIMRKDSNKA